MAFSVMIPTIIEQKNERACVMRGSLSHSHNDLLFLVLCDIIRNPFVFFCTFSPFAGGTKRTRSACTANVQSSAPTETSTLAGKWTGWPCLNTRQSCTSADGTAATIAPYATVREPIPITNILMHTFTSSTMHQIQFGRGLHVFTLGCIP